MGDAEIQTPRGTWTPEAEAMLASGVEAGTNWVE